MGKCLAVLVVLAVALIAWQDASADSDSCWPYPNNVPGENSEDRTYRRGWYAFAYSCKDGVDVGAVKLDQAATRLLVEKVYSDIGASWRPTLVWDSSLPAEMVATHRWAGGRASIVFRNEYTTRFTIIHEIVHGIMFNMAGSHHDWVHDPHGKKFRNLLLYLHQEFVWPPADVERLTRHACEAAASLRLTLLGYVDSCWGECGLQVP